MFTSGIMDGFSKLQSKVGCLENVLDSLAQDLVHRREHSCSAASKLTKLTQSQHSPRLSTSTPRPSIDIHNREHPLLSVKNTDIWEANEFDRSLTNNPTKLDTDLWTASKVKISRNSAARDVPKNSRYRSPKMACGQIRNLSGSIPDDRKNVTEGKNNVWKCVTDFLCEGDLDSAYVEALCSGDEPVLVELLDRTGPVLECLSSKTVNDVINLLASYLIEQRFMNTILPWLQQASSLCLTYGLDVFLFRIIFSSYDQVLLCELHDKQVIFLCKCLMPSTILSHYRWLT